MQRRKSGRQCFLCGPYRDYTTRACRHYETALGWQLKEYEVGVRWPPACKDVSPRRELRPLLEGVTKIVTGDTSL
jgi:hypothetical protein